MVGVFLIHGIQIGPTLFVTSKDLFYNLMAARLIGICAYGLIGYFVAAWIGRFIIKVPVKILYPIVLLTAFITAYFSRTNLFDVWVMVAAGFLGWLMKRFDFNPVAFVISFVLAGGAEQAFRKSLLLSDHGLLIFVYRPIALGFIFLGLCSLIYRLHSFYSSASKMHENK